MTNLTVEKTELKQNTWHLYLIRDKNNALYCGITSDVQRRFAQHQSGKGAKALKGKIPLTLVFHCQVGSRSMASQMEYQVKKLKKNIKERLVIDQPDNLKDYLANYKLSKCGE